jgi:putative copper resistance protein D
LPELAVICLRLVQYGAASILTGSALFFAYGLPREGPASARNLPWAKPLVATGAVALAVAAILGLVAQTVLLAGSVTEALRGESLVAVFTGMDFGKSAIVRAGLACLAATLLLIGGRGRATWIATGTLGALATASFAWMGHGASTEGGGHFVHLAADILHAMAAAVWLGALVAFVLLVRQKEQSAQQLQATRDALHGFFPVGVAVVATLVITGLANTWFLVDVANGLQSLYSKLLVLKIILFAGMFALATLHRQRAVPALTGGLSAGEDAPTSLRRSLAVEGALGFAVLAVVAWLGTLSPVG